MTTVQRLKAAGAILLLAAILTTSHVWGEAGKDDKGNYLAGRSEPAPAKTATVEEQLNTKFTKQPLVSYHTLGGADLFAMQVQPKLAAGPVRDRDYLLLVDTSASQARGPLETARLITEKVIAAAAGDRIAIGTVNTPAATRDLTRGLQSAKSDKVREALEALKQEYPSGDTDLKGGLTKAINAFDGREGRQRIILFLGDGMSLSSPISNADRQQLCEKMVAKEITFFTVPLGPRLDAVNLHGLATGTGGLLVRQMADQPADVVTKLQAAFLAPVLYTKKFQLPAEVSEFYPTKLPPLRSDVPTLVVGQFKPGQKLNYTLEGTVLGKDVRVQVSEEVPTAELDNFFLVSLVEQWKKADNKMVASPFRADRALAMSFERSRLARDEFLVQAQWALQQDNLEAANRLFGEAKRIDPSDVEADAGMKIVMKLRDGVLTRKQLREQLSKPEDPAIRIQKKEGDQRVKVSRDQLQNLLAQADVKEMAPPPVPQVDPALIPNNEDFLRMQKQRLAVEEQRINALVNDVERQSNRVLQTDPDTAHDLLKRTLGSIRDNVDLSPQTRQNLISRLETALRNVEVRGSRVKQELEARMLAQAAAEQKLAKDLDRLRGEEQIVRRMKAFGELMNQGRFNEAYREALVMQQDTINRGLTVSSSEVAAYYQGLAGTHLKEVTEVKRASEERYMLTMLQVDKSHIPFPDEPPVEFPPAATWKELTDRRRKAGYDAAGIGEDQAGRLAAQAIRDKLTRKVNLDKGIDPNTPLKDALEFLSDRYDLTIIIDSKAFESIGVQKPEEQAVDLPKMVGVSLATVLRLLLNKIKGDVYTGTYIIRRDYIEVTTTYNAAAEKVVRAYPVADLVIPIPNSVNQQALQQSLAVYGQFINASPPTFPQFPGAQGGGGAVPMPFAGGANPFGFQGNAPGNNQFGNLGGQFGLQGQDTSRQLLELIVSVVAPGEWRPLGPDPNAPPGAGPAGALAPPLPTDNPIVPQELLNSIGYYQPARALIVRGSSRIQARLEGGVTARPGQAPAAMGFNNNRDNGGGAIVIGPKGKTDPVAKTGPKVDPKTDPKANATAMKDVDVRQAWQEAIAKQKAQNKNGTVDPGIIIACADFLVEQRKFDHAAELLKASLREGVVPADPWVFESLALALQLSGGSAEEIERAQVSAIDVQPQDAKSYLQAAKAMAELKRYDRAVALCRQAALMEPGVPTAYANALVFAQESKDGESMAWAASHLLKQEWTTDNKDLHARAQEKLGDLVKELEREGKTADVQRLKAAATQTRRRDLIVNLTWQGDAALDLRVMEPVGSVCNYNHKLTPGGGTLLGGGLNEGKTQSYVAAEAFSGDYQVTVERVWGRPLGAKATLEIIRHQGTPQERVELQTITFDRAHTVKVSLADGRRTSVADIPAAAALEKAEKKTEMASSDNVLTKLRALSDPIYTPRIEHSGLTGGITSNGVESLRTRVEAGKPAANPNDRIAVNTRVANYVNQALDMTAQTTINTDQKEIRVRMTPTFNSVNRIGSSSGMSNPLIPGGY